MTTRSSRHGLVQRGEHARADVGASTDELTHQIEAVRGRIVSLHQRAGESPPQSHALLEEAFEELQTSLEELRAAEEELRERNVELVATRAAVDSERRRYQDLFQFAPDGYLVTDMRGVILEANHAAAALLNFAPPFVAGKPLVVFVAKEDQPTFRSMLSQLRHVDHVREVEVRLQRRGSGPFHAALTVAVVHEGPGLPIGLRWLVRDITERKRAEEQIRTLNAELEERVFERTAQLAEALEREQAARAHAEQLAAERAAILGHIADGLVIADPAGRITFANPAARRLCGLTEAGMADIFDSELACRFIVNGQSYQLAELPLIWAALHGEAVVHTEVSIQQPDAREVVTQSSATPVMTEDGSLLGAVLLLHDVTAQRAFERDRDEFLANISHDLRTPVAAIKAPIGVVLANEPPDIPAPLHRLHVNIDLAADRMAKLVSNVLDLTRLQAGVLQLRLAACDVRAVALRAARTIEPLAQERGQRITADLPTQPLVITADAGRVEQVLLNLLSNAHQYGRTGGTICLSLAQRSGEALFGVTDDGPGISEAEQAHIFERFYRSETQTAHQSQGSGLGLAIARGVVELHGGHLWVESTPGSGATFWFTLPMGGPAPGAAEETA